MKSDIQKSKNELLEELITLRQQAAKADDLQKRLTDFKKSYANLQIKYEERTKDYKEECNCRDNTDEALRMAKVIVDRSPAVLFRRKADDRHTLVYVSNNIKQLGYSADDFLSGRIQFRDIVHPDDVERVGAEISGYTERNVEEYTQVYRIICKSGEVHWVEDQTSVERDAEGNKTYNQGILVDITERKLAEEKLRKSEEKFRRIVETAGEGFILMDEDLVVVDVNDAYLRMLGYTRQELTGKTPIELATEEFKQFVLNNQETLLGQEYREFEGSCVAKDGRHVPILIHGNTLRDEFEELKGSGVALGVNETFDYKENNRRGLSNGQIIAIGTDGIWEAVNQKGEMFGKERFRGIIRKNAHAGASDVLNAVYSELNLFTRGQRSEDDITLVVVKIDGIE